MAVKFYDSILFSRENCKFSATCFLSFHTQLTYQLGCQKILVDQFLLRGATIRKFEDKW